MKRKSANPSINSSHSSSSSSCIESQNTVISCTNYENAADKKSLQRPTNPKRVRTKKTLNSATSAKSRTSVYRGVTRHRWTGRFEAHLWDKTTWNSIQNKKGRQIYLGAYDNEEDAARTYDLAAIKYWGAPTTLNFPLETYNKEMEEMAKLSKEEYLATLRRRSSGFSRGISKYRGVARHHQNGRWEARIGNVCGNKYLYLGTYSTQEEAAVAYDMAAIEFRGPNAVTNFDINNYAEKLKKIVPPAADGQDDHFPVKQAAQPVVSFDMTSRVDEVIILDQQHQQQLVGGCGHLAQPDELIELVSPMGMDMMEEHPWDPFLDMGGINSAPIAFEFKGLFDGKGFEEDIEYMFDGSFDDFEFHADEMSATSGESCKGNTSEDSVIKASTFTSTTSCLSTTTSFCSNFS